MVNIDDIQRTINPRLSQLLLVAQASMPESQFKAFRKLFLNEFGNTGLLRDLEQLLGNARRQDRAGTER